MRSHVTLCHTLYYVTRHIVSHVTLCHSSPVGHEGLEAEGEAALRTLVRSLPGVCPDVFLETPAVGKLPMIQSVQRDGHSEILLVTGLTLQACAVHLLNVLLKLQLLLELHATLSAAEHLYLVLLLVLCDVEEHGLSSGVGLPALRTRTLIDVVDLLQMSVQSLHEGGAGVAEAALPRFVVAVVLVHVIHQPSEASALSAAKLTHAELLVVLGNLPLGEVAQFPLLFMNIDRNILFGSSPFSLNWCVLIIYF